MDRHWLLKFGVGARHRVTRRAFSSGFLSALICGALKADAVKPFALDVRTVRLSPGVPTPFSFVHFSDTHLTETTATELAAAGAEGRALHERRAKVLYRNARAFAAVLTRIRETGSFAVNTGDLLDYVSDGGLSAAAAQRGLDILTTPGNHETMALDPARKLKEKAIVDFLKAQKNLKAVLAGHLHGFWQGTFNGVVPMIVAPANYDGRALEINLA